MWNLINAIALHTVLAGVTSCPHIEVENVKAII